MNGGLRRKTLSFQQSSKKDGGQADGEYLSHSLLLDSAMLHANAPILIPMPAWADWKSTQLYRGALFGGVLRGGDNKLGVRKVDLDGQSLRLPLKHMVVS